jgi:hypothetical protein
LNRGEKELQKWGWKMPPTAKYANYAKKEGKWLAAKERKVPKGEKGISATDETRIDTDGE